MDITLKCKVCNKCFTVPNYRKNAKYCSTSCQRESLKGRPNTVCPVCGKKFHSKPYHLRRYKYVCCSRECSIRLKRQQMLGSNNHQYGLKGPLNSSFKSGIINKVNNNLLNKMVYVGEWYVKPNMNGRIPKHRYVVESNWVEFNPNCFEVIGDWHYLKDGIEVHHVDFNHNNNDISNLLPLTKSEHVSIHNKARNQKRGPNGKFIKKMTLNEYQQKALETAIYPTPIVYPALGLCGESGEVADKVKKVLRDNHSVFADDKKTEIAKEIGDVLWYCATLSNDLGYTLDEIAEMNYQKLHSRQLRGKIGGSGDNR